ncbi:MAG: hypothetical protein ACT4O5_09685 [Gammaproteobacteria bacterium]
MEPQQGPLKPDASSSKLPSRKESGFYEPYADLHRNVRLWFLAYGIGAPVFLAQFPGAIDALRAGDLLRVVSGLFLGGVVVQVFAALLYKTAMWYLYMEELGEFSEDTKRVQVSAWLSEQYWLESLFDASTLILFAAATWFTVRTVA